MLMLNLLDVEYFKYTSKRSTADLFTIMGTGDDLSQLIGAFLRDFWWLLVTLVVLVIASHFLYKKTRPKEFRPFKLAPQVLVFGFGTALLFIMGRGGLSLRPADALTAAQYTRIENTGLVLNTPLTIIKTIGKHSLVEVEFFAKKDSHLIYNPIKETHPAHQIGKNVNVMVIILESFGNEWMGKQTGGPFTPFLDSLIDESLYFSNAFANGKKSIEAVPAILAGIPSLLDEPYITSNYGTNAVDALPAMLVKKGYTSAFFHGATNGSMKFDEFSVLAGFEKYFGRTEYNNDEHNDQTWGILDEYFMPWTATTITRELKEPFIAGLFTLSSHHPYFIPEKHRKNLPNGETKLAKSIAYTDMSLKLFFEEAKKQPWYENTVFVICADHTPAGHDAKFNQRTTMYQIPILFFDPQGRISPDNNETIFSHIDISPTLLDLVGYSDSYYSFGNSFFDSGSKYAMNYLEGTYHLFKDNYMINFSGEKTKNIYNYKVDPYMIHDSLKQLKVLQTEYEIILKGIIQRYNHDLIQNKTKAQ
jgi:phosphoglycerol transferase MdoB-like AlkP superfamily enzyme